MIKDIIYAVAGIALLIAPTVTSADILKLEQNDPVPGQRWTATIISADATAVRARLMVPSGKCFSSPTQSFGTPNQIIDLKPAPGLLPDEDVAVWVDDSGFGMGIPDCMSGKWNTVSY
jgi:hypothetical protein